MAYTTATKVKSMFRDFATGTNVAVTDAEIEDFILEVDAVIDGSLSGYYESPIAGTQSLLILERICRLIVAGQVDDILNNYSEADKKPMWSSDGKKLLESITPKYNCKCERWESPKVKLPDTDLIGVPENPAKTYMSVQQTEVAPTFKKGVDTW